MSRGNTAITQQQVEQEQNAEAANCAVSSSALCGRVVHELVFKTRALTQDSSTTVNPFATASEHFFVPCCVQTRCAVLAVTVFVTAPPCATISASKSARTTDTCPVMQKVIPANGCGGATPALAVLVAAFVEAAGLQAGAGMKGGAVSTGMALAAAASASPYTYPLRSFSATVLAANAAASSAVPNVLDDATPAAPLLP